MVTMPPKKTTAKKRTMSQEHKEAIAEGRAQAKAVSSYLDALESTKRKRGRQRSVEKIKSTLASIDERIDEASPLAALNLRQEKKDLEAELANRKDPVDVSAFEADFVAHAAAYGDRKGISYQVWREAGVSPAVLKKAGISRGS